MRVVIMVAAGCLLLSVGLRMGASDFADNAGRPMIAGGIILFAVSIFLFGIVVGLLIANAG